jgi:NADPH2:quinone reductase
LIEVVAAGVTYGDIMKRRGTLGTPGALPYGIGVQVAGRIAQIGTGVSAVAVGDRVAARVDAGYAEFAVADVDAIISISDTLSFGGASILPVQGITAYQALTEAGRMEPADVVLVHAAAGGVGSLAVQLARLLGAGRVIGTAGDPEKLEHVRGLGADAAINYRVPHWRDDLLAATNGRGPDVVLDSVGGDISADSLSMLAPFGRLVCFGAASGVPARPDAMRMMDLNAVVAGYSLFGALERPERTASAIAALTAYTQSAELRLTIGRTFGLEQAARAHQAIEDRHTVGCTVLAVGAGQ